MSDANHRALWLVLAGSVAIGLLACSADSLWIDEAWVALIASEKTFSGWWHRMQEISGSTLQMPVYTLYLWGWEKLAGHSEWALRSANIPFFMLGQWALFRSFREERCLALWTVGIAALSPFLWSYIAEARPYAMQYGAACLVIGGVIQLAKGHHFTGRDCVLFCVGLALLCGTSSLAFPWAGMGLLSAAFLIWRNNTLVRLSLARILLLLGTGLVLLGIFFYDLWAARSGGRASSAGKTGSPNLLFVAYELLGFAGLGPARLAIRESPSLAVLAPFSLSLGALALALGVAASRLRKVERSVVQAMLLYAVTPFLFVTTLAFFAPFRLLGRHVTPLVPVVFVLLAYSALRPARWWINRLFLVLWVVSAVLLRMAPRHRRDDYRGAAELARESLADGRRVWWAADAGGAEYYGLALSKTDTGSSTAAFLAANRHDLAKATRPDVILLSKGDIFDAAGDVRSFLEANSYRQKASLPAFTIWRAGN